MSSLRIAFFNKQLPSDSPNGVSCQVDRLAQALSERGHRVTCFSFSPQPRNAAYEVRQLPKRPSSPTGKFSAGAQFFRVPKEPFDILHYHGDDYLCPADCRSVRTFYGSAFFEAIHATTWRRFLYQSVFYGLELVSLLKHRYTTAIDHRVGRVLPGINKIIPCGVPDSFTPKKTCTKRPSILFIGDLHSRKQGELLVKVFIEKIQLHIPRCTLTIIGPDHIAHPAIICKSQISPGELVEEYQKAWLYCSTSSYEGFGVPLIEAMACGTPVISLSHWGARENIRHGTNGLICTPMTLADSILRVLQNNTFRDRLSKAGLRKAGLFSMSRIAARYENIYDSLNRRRCRT